MKTIGLTFFGLALFLGGFAILYFYISRIEQGSTPLLLIPSFLFVGVGIFLFFRVTNSDTKKVVLEEAKLDDATVGGLKDTLEKNNELVAQWNKTAQSEDKLRLLKLRAEAEEKAAKSPLS